MSELESKLEHVESAGGRARATLGQLMKRWGSPKELDGKTAPEMVLVRQLDGTLEYWRPCERGKTPTATVYEQAEVVVSSNEASLRNPKAGGE